MTLTGSSYGILRRVAIRVLDGDVVQFGPQESECRFRTLVAIDTAGLQSVKTGAATDVGQRVAQAIPAVEPAMRPPEGGQVFLVAEKVESGECGLGHRHRLHRLLIVG